MSTQEWEALEKKAEAILEIAGDDDDENIYKEKGLLTQETLHEQGEVYQETLRILKNLDKKENQDILLEVFRHYNKTINYDDIQGIKLSELSEAEIMKETGLTSFPAVLEIPIPVWYPYFIVDSNNKIVDGYFNKNECLGDKNINCAAITNDASRPDAEYEIKLGRGLITRIGSDSAVGLHIPTKIYPFNALNGLTIIVANEPLSTGMHETLHSVFDTVNPLGHDEDFLNFIFSHIYNEIFAYSVNVHYRNRNWSSIAKTLKTGYLKRYFSVIKNFAAVETRSQKRNMQASFGIISDTIEQLCQTVDRLQKHLPYSALVQILISIDPTNKGKDLLAWNKVPDSELLTIRNMHRFREIMNAFRDPEIHQKIEAEVLEFSKGLSEIFDNYHNKRKLESSRLLGEFKKAGYYVPPHLRDASSPTPSSTDLKRLTSKLRQPTVRDQLREKELEKAGKIIDKMDEKERKKAEKVIDDIIEQDEKEAKKVIRKMIEEES